MPHDDEDKELVASVAEQFALPVETLQKLLDLAEDFPNMSSNRAKTRLLRSVTEILDASTEEER
ncbi:hypothetical protein [Devosia sp.]|uniref:hypothetical protein n=1 Tax=Devosia sp. TaxID=1871048 RepID=UPI001AD01FDC|nr:hypothetical protein [Devosia sp.]MBN9336084.1 hypothetical protein [Devosia sp.]